MLDYFRRGPSKESLREMLAEAMRNTEAKKAAAAKPCAPVLPSPEDEAGLEEIALAMVEAVEATPVVAEAPPPPKRDFLYVDPPRAPIRDYAQINNLDPHRMKRGSPEQMARLEEIRRIQEAAWFRKGYSREEIIQWFGRWPTDHGYPAYAAAIGDVLNFSMFKAGCAFGALARWI